MKNIPSIQFNKSLNIWHIPDTAENRRKCGLPITEPPSHVSSKKKNVFVNESNIKALDDMLRAMKKKKYSENTTRIYRMEMLQFLYMLADYPVQKINTKQLSSYLLFCTEELKVKDHQMHLRINAIKFYFFEVLQKNILPVSFSRPRNKYEVKGLNEQDITKIYESKTNIKYKFITLLAYSCGIKVKDITTLRVGDLDINNKLIFVRKINTKDKQIALDKNLVLVASRYLKEFKPERFLFEGSSDESYSIRSIQHAIKCTLEVCRIRKKISTPGLSKSFTEHLLDHGADIASFKSLVGYNKQEVKMEIKAKKFPLSMLLN